MSFLVTEAAMRPGSPGVRRCFYCQKAIGDTHEPTCVTIKKNVLVRVTVEYEVAEPASWDKSMIEYHRNDASWCADNALGELEDLAGADGCLCGILKTEYLKDMSEPYLSEL